MNNKEIRFAVAGAGLKLWELAEVLGYSESGFSRKLRKELPEAEKQQILGIVKELAMDKEKENN